MKTYKVTLKAGTPFQENCGHNHTTLIDAQICRDEMKKTDSKWANGVVLGYSN